MKLLPDWAHRLLLTRRGRWLLDHKYAVEYSLDTAARANERLRETRSIFPFRAFEDTLQNETWWYDVDERLGRVVRTDGKPCTLQPIIVQERDRLEAV